MIGYGCLYSSLINISMVELEERFETSWYGQGIHSELGPVHCSLGSCNADTNEVNIF